MNQEKQMSIAYINGDSHYGSTVLFIIGGTKGQQIEVLVKRAMDDGNYDWFIDVINTNSEEFGISSDDLHCCTPEELLTKAFTNNLQCFNADFSKPSEIYFYISEQSVDEWYKHMEFITGGREGIKIDYVRLDTDDTGIKSL